MIVIQKDLNFPNDTNDDNSVSFKFKQKVTGHAYAGGTKDVEIMVSLKYLSTFWRTLEMAVINCESNFILILSANYVISAVANPAVTVPIADTKP